MSTKYTITEGPYSLKELASKVKLPQVVLVTQGFYGATEKDTISGGQVMVAFFIKRTRGVTGIYKKRSFHIPLNSAMQFAPIPSEGMHVSHTSIQKSYSSPVTLLLHFICIYYHTNNPAIVLYAAYIWPA